jgi:hypothetical protein
MKSRYATALASAFGVSPLEMVGWLMFVLGLPVRMVARERRSIKTLGLVVMLSGFLIVIMFSIHDFTVLGQSRP